MPMLWRHGFSRSQLKYLTLEVAGVVADVHPREIALVDELREWQVEVEDFLEQAAVDGAVAG